MASMLAHEEMGGDNQPVCNRCNARADATRRVRVTELPEVVVMHLVRFTYDRASQSKKKVKVRCAV